MHDGLSAWPRLAALGRAALPNLAVLDQGGAYGAVSGAPRAGLSLERPARRARAVLSLLARWSSVLLRLTGRPRL
jgi:hypothetical protein